jgi:hypothetical protein
VAKIIAYGGLDEDFKDEGDDDDRPPVSLASKFDLAKDDSIKDNTMMEWDDDLNSDNGNKKDNTLQDDELTNSDDTSLTYKDNEDNKNITNKDKKDNKNNKNNKNKNKNNRDIHAHDNLDDETPVLSLLKLEAHTAKWTTLSQTAKNAMPYLSSERDKARVDLDKCLLKWDGINKDTATKDQWASAFDKSYKARKTHKGGLIKIFGIKLAGTKPTELFSDAEFDGSYLFGSPLANAWAGAYIFYGPVWNPQHIICLDVTHGTAKPTSMWNNLNDDITSNSTPFRHSEIFADNPRSMHDLERHLRIKLKLPNSPTEVDPKAWNKAFLTHQTNHEVFATAVKLALTPISVFSKDMFADQKQKKLIASSVTNFWAGAYRLFGAPWAHTKDTRPINTAKSAQKGDLGVSFAQAAAAPAKSAPAKVTIPSVPVTVTATPAQTKSPPDTKAISFAPGTRTSGLFISRPPRKFAPQVKPKADVRKYEAVYYTVILQEIEVDWRDAGPAAIASFLEATEHIFAKDKKARILGFQNDSVAAFTKKSVPMQTKSALKRYFSNGYFQTGKRPSGRIRISHDVEPSLLEIESNQFSVIHEVIQEKDKTNIGFLVGSMPDVANLEDMREAHGNHSVLKNLKMVFVNEPISLTSGKSPIAWKEQVPAIHILVGESQSMLARKKYNEVYGSRNKGGYPQGVQMRFVPAIDDQRYPVTPSMKMKTIKMMCKQKVFLASLSTISTTTIAGLHHYIPKLGYNLCQVLMAMKSFKSPEMGLFISIDEVLDDHNYMVTFTSHVDRETEAKSLVPLLCLVLEAKFGYRIWEWFTNDAKKASSQWRWDSELSSLIPLATITDSEQDDCLGIDSDDEYTMSMCDLHNVDTTVSSDGFEFDLAFIISEDLLNEAPNQFGDSGSVKTFREECQTNEVTKRMDTEKHPKASSSTKELDSTPDDMIVDSDGDNPTMTVEDDDGDNSTREPSTITDATEDVEKSLEALMLSHPDLVRKLLNKSKLSHTTIKNKLLDNQKSTAVSPNEGVDGN